MSTGSRLPQTKARFWDANGKPLSAGKVYTYLQGSTTPATTFSDYNLSAQNTNPVILDAAGSANIFLPLYIGFKLVIKDKNDAVIDVQDNLFAQPALPYHTVFYTEVFTATAGQTVIELEHSYIPGAGFLQVTRNGVPQVSGTDYIETSTTSFTFITPLALNDSVGVVITGVSFGTVSLQEYSYSVPNNSITSIVLPWSYTVGDNSLVVFLNGILVKGNYTEASTTTVEFAAGTLVQGDIINFYSGYPISNTVGGGGSGGSGATVISADIQTAGAGQSIFNLGVEYVIGNNSLQTFVNGVRQNIVSNYNETSSTQVVFTSPLNAGDNVTFLVFTAIDASLTGATSVVVQSITATASQSVFDLATPYVVGSNLLSVFVNGARQVITADYAETNSTRVTFTTGLNLDDVATFQIARIYPGVIAFASSVNYVYPATGAVNRSVQSALDDVVSVLDFGADRTGATDSTAAMSNAHATGKVVYYPSGTYKFSNFSFASGGMRGDGRDQTILLSTDTSGTNAINYTGSFLTAASTPLFADISIFGPSSAGVTTKVSGAGLSFSPASSEVGYINLRNVTFAYWPVCLDFLRASYWFVSSCQFLAYTIAGMRVANENNPDSGDGSVVGCLFNAGGTTGEGILQYSSGGVKITGNKFLGGNTGYSLLFKGTSNTGVLVFSGNSVENMTNQCMVLSRISGAGNFSNTVITGNEFAVGPTGIQTDGSNFLSEVVISGNVFNMIGAGTGYGINLATVINFNINGNTFKGNGGTVTGIVIAASCSNGKIGKNTYSTLTNTLLNSSTTTWVDYDTQVGTTTSSAAGWGGFGALFSGPATSVTFPTPFTVAPVNGNVILNVSSTNGACGYIITGISTTGFTYIPLSSTNPPLGGAGFTYSARGII